MNKSHDGESPSPFRHTHWNATGRKKKVRLVGLRVYPRDHVIMDGGYSGVKQEFSPEAKGLLLRKLGEKLAFERAFLRLHEAYLKKRWGAARALGNPLAEGLQEFEEIVNLKRKSLERIKELIWDRGGDPNALVPSDELSAIAQLGIVTVFTNPESSLKSLVHAVRVVELAGRTSGLYLAHIAAAADDEALFRELETMQKHCDQLINQFALMSTVEMGRKRTPAQLRAVRRKLHHASLSVPLTQNYLAEKPVSLQS